MLISALLQHQLRLAEVQQCTGELVIQAQWIGFLRLLLIGRLRAVRASLEAA